MLLALANAFGFVRYKYMFYISLLISIVVTIRLQLNNKIKYNIIIKKCIEYRITLFMFYIHICYFFFYFRLFLIQN